MLETQRLFLRELTLEDAPELAKVLSDKEAMQYYPVPFSKEKVESWIQWNIENYRKYNHGLWAVISKQTGEFIGDCGITMQEIESEVLPEIGFHILPKYWNHGYATEAAEACKKYAFEVMQYPAVFSYTILENLPSQKVAQKIGMKLYKKFEKSGKEQIVQMILKEEYAINK